MHWMDILLRLSRNHIFIFSQISSGCMILTMWSVIFNISAYILSDSRTFPFFSWFSAFLISIAVGRLPFLRFSLRVDRSLVAIGVEVIAHFSFFSASGCFEDGMLLYEAFSALHTIFPLHFILSHLASHFSHVICTIVSLLLYISSILSNFQMLSEIHFFDLVDRIQNC